MLAIVPSLNKFFLVEAGKAIPMYVTSEIETLENRVTNSPRQLVLLLTNNCNLACQYCYEFSMSRESGVMPLNLIDSAIEQLFNESAKENRKSVKLTLFGGEPTLAWDRLLYSVNKARELELIHSIPLRISLVTNGVTKRDFSLVLESIDHFTISIDGPPEIQNKLRPIKDGSHSSGILARTIGLLFSKVPKKLTFRITLTPDTLNHFAEIADYLFRLYPGIPQSYEPIMPTTRLEETVAVQTFFDTFLQLVRKYSPLKQIIHTSLFSLTPSMSFCGMERRTVVFPNGELSGCHRVNAENADDPVLRYFGYGAMTNGSNASNQDGISNAREATLTGKLGQACEECFAKYYCRGGCPALKLGLGGTPFQRHPWCNSIRHFYIEYFLRKLADS